MAHAFLAPSAAHRWGHCPGSVAMERLYPEQTSSAYAEEGSLAHAWAAKLLDPGQPDPQKPLPEEHRQFIQSYVDFIKRETEGGIREIEFKVELLTVTGEAGAKGTIDCACLVGNTLKIIDLKFGEGVLVDAHKNPQLLVYALAAREFFSMFAEIKDIEMTIFQPRKDHIDTWKLTAKEADVLAIRVRDKAAKALGFVNADPLPPEALCPNVEACRFCKAKSACPALRQMAAQAVDFKPVADEKPIPVVMAEALSPEKLSESMKIADLLEPWIAAIREQTRETLMSGVEVPDFKLVLGRPGNRQWTNSTEAEEALKRCKLKEDERYTFKVISPTQAEKLFKAGRIGPHQWPNLQGLISRADPAPVVAPATDKREAYQPVSQAKDFSPLP